MQLSFFNKYKHKIKSKEDLKKIINKNKSKKFIVCHGVFDIVHPGHVRHLIHAKNHADILIVSLTKDKFIKKGKNRPHVPENLRCLNMSAFEMVDYVLLDNEKTPINLIKYLKPNYFAKGFEYSSTNINQNTIKEEKTVSKYGGKMIFTPGDIVYSSTKVLKNFSPKIEIEKTLSLMESHNISFEYLKKTIKNFKKFKLHVIGDIIIDGYTETHLSGSKNKTPTFSVIRDSVKNYIGGAGVVASHVKATGANVTLTTLVGKDKFKNFIETEFKKNNIDLNLIVDDTRPTTYKNVFIANNYKLLKVDDVNNDPISNTITKKFQEEIKKTKSDAIIFSDFRHGIFNKSNIKLFTKSIDKKIFKVADSQVASRWGNISDFINFDLITPNEYEARFSVAEQDCSLNELAILLQKKTHYKNLILKLGSSGVFCSSRNNHKYFVLNSFVNDLIDPVGAGDALCAYSTLGFLSSKSLAVAALIGSFAAACECEYNGNKPIKAEDVITRIESYEKNANFKK